MRSKTPTVCIIGAGMSGLLMAIRLQKAGYSNFSICEKASSLGGTWRENTYPGVACDVPSHYYSYSFAQNADWSRKFAAGSEILKYFESIADKYQLRDKLRFNKEASKAEFDGKKWRVSFKDNTEIDIDFVISACGILHQPVFPDIKGLKEFNGNCFHSSQWDHSAGLQGKKIGVIGSGSTGTQMMAPLSDLAAELKLFQRTAEWIMPVKETVYSPESKWLRHWIPGLAKLQYQITKKIFEAFSELVIKDLLQSTCILLG